jgi:cholesterol transport system auxiliary component
LNLPLGCTGLVPGSRPPPRIFRLTPKSTFPADLPRVDWQMIVEAPVANAGLDTTRVALMRGPHEIEYYARSSWVDTAPLMVQTLIIESFENSGKIVSVGRESLGLRADYLLKLELREFQAEYREGPLPRAHVAISAKLVKLPARQIVAAQTFEGFETASADAVEEVVNAMDLALGRVLRDIVVWTLTSGEEFWGGASGS